jgi:hypothetical protein
MVNGGHWVEIVADLLAFCRSQWGESFIFKVLMKFMVDL